MKKEPVKLGVMALLLLVISICLVVLGVLTFSTAQADLRLSQRYAETTAEQYRLEAAGQEFLRQAYGALPDLDRLEGVTLEDGIYRKVLTRGDNTLTVGLRLRGDGVLEVDQWESSIQWAPEGQGGALWEG